MKIEKRNLFDKVDKFIEKHEILSVIIMMAAAVILLSHSFFDVYPLHSTTDELGAIVGAASLAGYDWSGVIDRSGYYGFGYYALFAPLFKMHLSPIVIYRIILIVTRVIRGSLISGIAYYIGKHYYKFPSKLELLMLSFICTIPLHPLNYANIINDVVLDVFFWIIILSLCKIAENSEKTSKCIKWIFIYIAAAFWCSFLHTRALVMIIASFLVLLGLLFYKRKFSFLLAMLVVPVTIVSKILIKMYQSNIWMASGDGLTNASVSVAENIPILNVKSWEIWFTLLISHISVQTLLTGGLFLLAIVASVKYLYMMVIQKQKEGTIYTNIVFATSVLSMGAAFAAFSVSGWFMNLYNTWDTMEKGYAYCYKGLCYVRYWNVFAMPFLFTGIYLVNKKEYRDCIRQTVFLFIIIFLTFIEKVVPIIQYNSPAGSFLFTYLTDRSEGVTEQFYYKCILVCVVFGALALVIYYGKIGKEWAIFPIVLLMAVGYNNANENYNRRVTEQISSMVLSSYEQKCKLEEAEIDIGQVYAYDDRVVDNNWYIFSVLQFYFYEYRVEDEYPKTVETNDIIVTYGRSEKIEKDFPQLECYQLDDNEVWYTNIELIGIMPIER